MFGLMSRSDTPTYRTFGSLKKNLSFPFACTKFRHKCYYSVLGLDSGASADDIKSAYYKLSMKFHPDKNSGSVDAADKFREITEAYEVLGNTERKLKYDNQSFRPQYRTAYENFSFGNERQKTYTYRKPRQPPRTGRSEEFNYDEHFQRHYEEIFRRNEEYARAMRAARLKWEQEQYSNPYAGQSRSHTRARPDSFNRPLSISPWSIFMVVWLVMTLSFCAEFFTGDVPHKPGHPSRSSKE